MVRGRAAAQPFTWRSAGGDGLGREVEGATQAGSRAELRCGCRHGDDEGAGHRDALSGPEPDGGGAARHDHGGADAAKQRSRQPAMLPRDSLALAALPSGLILRRKAANG